eukprot:comp20288_c0_seq1/m.25458 comp20288_c0_seq1/g.25458  ORF comp20288_c0_seq1/g.25458 comp20288_c0_seq1/m.25458 type:complete len:323 (-) comp20288_c0_seq1:266-1234(-)
MGPKRSLPASVAGANEQPTPKKVKAVGLEEGEGDGAGSATTKKSGKKVKEVEEKRLARWRTSANENVRQRIERAVTQRMYMVDRTRKSDTHESFAVLGSTGNVYTVDITHKLSCDCPDFQKRQACCKHILFVFLKVLKQPPTSAYIYQSALVTKELQEIFDAAPIDPRDVLANKNVVAAYKGSDSQAGEEGKEEGRRPAEGPCPVCFEDMNEGGKEALTWCRTCGNNMHMDCFRQWRGREVASGKQVTCVYCRAVWLEASAGTPGKGDDVSKEGYRNLGSLQGMSTERDTSTYYQNPLDMPYYYGRKRGRGWGRGYGYYDDY